MWDCKRRSCMTVYTHPDITCQVVVYHNTGEIIWNSRHFDSVKQAKEYAEERHNAS